VHVIYLYNHDNLKSVPIAAFSNGPTKLCEKAHDIKNRVLNRALSHSPFTVTFCT